MNPVMGERLGLCMMMFVYFCPMSTWGKQMLCVLRTGISKVRLVRPLSRPGRSWCPWRMPPGNRPRLPGSPPGKPLRLMGLWCGRSMTQLYKLYKTFSSERPSLIWDIWEVPSPGGSRAEVRRTGPGWLGCGSLVTARQSTDSIGSERGQDVMRDSGRGLQGKAPVYFWIFWSISHLQKCPRSVQFFSRSGATSSILITQWHLAPLLRVSTLYID